MSKIKRRIKKFTDSFKMVKFPQIKCPFEKRKLILVSTILLVLIPLTVFIVIGISQYRELLEINDQMDEIGARIQLGYHREFNLVERLNIIDLGEFKTECGEFSYNCLYLGRDLRTKFLEKLETESFNDEDMEVLNMISSIDFTTKMDSESFNKLVREYNEKLEQFPISLATRFLSKESLL